MAEREPDPPKPPRRAFLDVAITSVAAGMGVAAIYPFVRFLEPAAAAGQSEIVLGLAEEFERGSARAASLGGQPIMVIRSADGSFRAFVAICTHLQCVVRYVPEHDWIECGCHDGRFSADGRPMAGPVSRCLPSLRVDVVDGSVVVSAS